MSPAQTRLKELKELLKAEADQNSLYAQDLKLSIAAAKLAVKNVSDKGYRMVR